MVWQNIKARLNAVFVKRIPVIRQMELGDCGISCLCAIAQSDGADITLSGLKIRYGTSLQGTTLYQLLSMARDLGYTGRGIAFSMSQLEDVALPAIVHWNANHYVVVEKVGKSFIEVMDPAVGRRIYTHDEFGLAASGYALELSIDKVFDRRRVDQPLRFRDFIVRNRNTWSFLFFSLLLTLVIEAAFVATPFFVQLVIDEAVAKNDRDILNLLMIIFGGIAIWDIGARFLRGYLHMDLAARLHNDAKVGLVSRLLALPLSWFDARGVSQIYQRLRQIDLLQSSLSEGTFSALLDGAFSLVGLAIMFIISPLLAVLSTLVLVIYLLVRHLMMHSIQRRMGAQLAAVAKADGDLLRLISDIQSIKLTNAEAGKLNCWTNMQLDASRERVWLQMVGYRFALFSGALRHAERLAIIYLGATFAMKGDISVGMVFAFLMFRDQFLDKSISCVQVIYDLKQSEGMLDELRDIADTPPERSNAGFSAGNRSINAGAELRMENVGFTYAAFAEPILHDINLVIAAGEKVAITGGSGSGKSTLLKIFTSLYQPTSGVFRVDGVDINRIALSDYRHQIAVLDSKPSFYNGSILENIYFESQEQNVEWAVECAHFAGLHDDILRQPGGYATLVSAHGSSLSSGQGQRLLMARALYARPNFLILDEPTAHLDAPTERAIVERLLKLKATVIVVTHNPAVLALFSSVLRVEQGTLRIERAAA